ncbi:hypothetical protein DFS34DRAFT_665720 [Phlyctochytrium arcticum]|nr:hypothetical protein DFS34DRAFT_665720 [Phlyctochytrium arcticum]
MRTPSLVEMSRGASEFDRETRVLLQQNLGEHEFENDLWEYWSKQTFQDASIPQLDEQELRRDLDDPMKKLGTATKNFVTILHEHSSYIKNRSASHEQQHLVKGVLDAWPKKHGGNLEELWQERRKLWARRGVAPVEWDGVFEGGDADIDSLVVLEAKSSFGADFLACDRSTNTKGKPVLWEKIQRTFGALREAHDWVGMSAKEQKAESWMVKKDQHRCLAQFARNPLIVILGYEVLPKDIDFSDVKVQLQQKIGPGTRTSLRVGDGTTTTTRSNPYWKKGKKYNNNNKKHTSPEVSKAVFTIKTNTKMTMTRPKMILTTTADDTFDNEFETSRNKDDYFYDGGYENDGGNEDLSDEGTKSQQLTADESWHNYWDDYKDDKYTHDQV